VVVHRLVLVRVLVLVLDSGSINASQSTFFDYEDEDDDEDDLIKIIAPNTISVFWVQGSKVQGSWFGVQGLDL
jgi:hypothetical protein